MVWSFIHACKSQAMKSKAPADGRALFLNVCCLAVRYRRDTAAVNSCPQRYLPSLIADPPALLQVLFSWAAFSCWTSRCQRSQLHILEKQKQSDSGVCGQGWVNGVACHHSVWRAALCKVAVEMEEVVWYLDEGTGNVVRRFVSVLSSPHHSDL